MREILTENMRLVFIVDGFFSDIKERFGVSKTDFKILSLAWEEEFCCVYSVIKRVNVDRALISRRCNFLEEEGYIRRIKGKKGRRIELLPKAYEVLRYAASFNFRGEGA